MSTYCSNVVQLFFKQADETPDDCKLQLKIGCLLCIKRANFARAKKN